VGEGGQGGQVARPAAEARQRPGAGSRTHGLATDDPDPTLVESAFDAADRRATSLRVVQGWNPAPYCASGLSSDLELHTELSRQQAPALRDVLRPWRLLRSNEAYWPP
jgi:hypothetical protein